MSNFVNEGKIRGIIHLIEETKTFGQKGFRKRVVVLEQPGDRFTNYVPIEFTQDACDKVDGLKLGQEIEVSFRLSGRRWQKDPNSEVKFFVNPEAWNFKVVSGEGDAKSDSIESANDEFAQASYEEDDIPF
ncbi:MAG: DUF3127 domain-containing protein [Planctomycetaceae bacterium]|jgi:hypothetical protein|nr:DUF3127 domain-containing protein [Planctomycetaceae bacterium]